jgi:hypothetical protein
MNEDVLGYVLDALDASEEAAIEARLERDPKFRADVEAIRKSVQPLACDDVILPPDGLADRTIAFVKGAKQLTESAEWPTPSNRFRLVDVLAAAAIFTVAASLLFPAVINLRLQQTRTACANQLRQLGVALAVYADQEGCQLPYVDAGGPMSRAGVFAVLLKTKELISDGGQLVCPAADNAVAIVPDRDAYLKALQEPQRLQWLCRLMSGSYGYVLGFQESGVHLGYNVRRELQPIVSDRPPRPEESAFENSPNHGGSGQNVLFVGGNVRWVPGRRFSDDDLFHNRGGQVAAGTDRGDTVIGVSEAMPYPTVEL